MHIEELGEVLTIVGDWQSLLGVNVPHLASLGA